MAVLIGLYQIPVEKARKKLTKNATCCFEQILEVTIYKTIVVQPLTSHLTNHPSKMNKTYRKNKEKLINIVLLWAPTHGPTIVGQSAKTFHLLWANTGWHLEDRGSTSRVMANRNVWWEKERESREFML